VLLKGMEDDCHNPWLTADSLSETLSASFEPRDSLKTLGCPTYATFHFIRLSLLGRYIYGIISDLQVMLATRANINKRRISNNSTQEYDLRLQILNTFYCLLHFLGYGRTRSLYGSFCLRDWGSGSWNLWFSPFSFALLLL
jgi:hypothetical protein